MPGWSSKTIDGREFVVDIGTSDDGGRRASYKNPSATVDTKSGDYMVVRMPDPARPNSPSEVFAIQKDDVDDSVGWNKTGTGGGTKNPVTGKITALGPDELFRGLGREPDPNVRGDKGSLLYRATSTGSRALQRAADKVGSYGRSKDPGLGKVIPWATKALTTRKKKKPETPITSAIAGGSSGSAT